MGSPFGSSSESLIQREDRHRQFARKMAERLQGEPSASVAAATVVSASGGTDAAQQQEQKWTERTQQQPSSRSPGRG